MSQSFRITTVAITSTFMMALAAGCGHSKQLEDAFERSKNGGPVMSSGGTTSTGGTGGTGGMTSGSGGMGATPPMGCTDVESQQFDSVAMKHYVQDPKVMKDVNDTLALMNTSGWISQMLGVDIPPIDYLDIERSPDVEVAGLGTVRGYNYRDAGHGVNLDAGQSKGSGSRQSDGNDFSTVFPAASLRAASWDLDLERRVGMALGDETAASKNNMLLAPCMNIIRHPYWGRTQETYSEDSYHIGRMAAAFTVGLQNYVTGCAKHFAANNIEKARSTQNAIMDEQTLREIYGRHFEMVIQDGGIGCIMASYNKINETKSTQNRHLLTDILRGPLDKGGMDYKGLVISDWWAMPGDQMPAAAGTYSDAVDAVKAGLDIEVPWTLHYSQPTLGQAITNGDISAEDVKAAAARVLEQKYRFKTVLTTDGYSLTPPTSKLSASGGSIETNLTHEDLAEEAQVKSAVLLSNGVAGMPVLPLASPPKVAVIGLDDSFSLISTTPPKSAGVCSPLSADPCVFHFATDAPLGDRGSSRVNGDPMRTVGPFAGINAAAMAHGGMAVAIGNADPTAAAAAAATENADVNVVVVGYTPEDEGEEYAIAAGGDRSSLNLPPGHNELVNAVLALNKPTVIIIESGSIVNVPWIANQNQATIWAGYGGVRAGTALGKLIYGDKNFTGKMPMAWPTQETLDAEGQVFKETEGATHMGYFFGYREYDRRKAAGKTVNLVFPFGHGMSYSTYQYSELTLPCQSVTKKAIFNVSVKITNTSQKDGDEIAMLFVKPPATTKFTGQRPVKELKSFARVPVAAGATVTAELPLRIQDLRRWEGNETGKWVIDSGDYTIMVGKDADDAEAGTIKGTLTVQGD